MSGEKITPLCYDEEKNLFPIICFDGVIMFPGDPVLKAYPEHVEKLIDIAKQGITKAKENPTPFSETAEAMKVEVKQ